MILHPEEMGIERTEATWGDMDADVVFEEDTSSQEELDHLHEFNYNSLNYEQQLAYDVVERTLEENIEQAKDVWFYEYFSPLSGVQTQIPILFSEYAFAEKQDVEDCLNSPGRERRIYGLPAGGGAAPRGEGLLYERRFGGYCCGTV